MSKKVLSAIMAISMIGSCCALAFSGSTPFQLDVSAKEAADYTYSITPILSPFNEYFFVKTDNPDPLSFRFVDKSTVYGENGDNGLLSFLYDSWDEEPCIYADIVYEDKNTARVNGGYIFSGGNTDGGKVTLQYKKDISYSEYDELQQSGDYANIGQYTETLSSSSGSVGFKTYRIVGYYKWEDSNVSIELPRLKNYIDYLLDTYASKDSFFENMDAVQAGLSSICLYSGSFIRGELYKAGEYWSLSTSPHKDQSFYIQSPYARKDRKSLFASVVYPFRASSLGFPSIMAEVSKRLDSSSAYEWDDYSHYLIHVTYNGETHMYGGQGNGKWQGITEDKIKKYYTFDDKDKITLESARQLLEDYSELQIPDDVPREDALTWEKVCDTVGDGAWVRLTEIVSILGGTQTGYTYLYKKNDGKYHRTDSSGSNGGEIYWGGDLGYLSDAWVDGRYIDECEGFVPGAKFEDHPTSAIMLKSMTIPQISYDYSYRYNYDLSQWEIDYSDITINEQTAKNVLLYHDENVWKVSDSSFENGCAGYDRIAYFVEEGLIDRKYLDMVTLTSEEVKALNVDKNTNEEILKGYIYDGTDEPGTRFGIADFSDETISVSLSSSIFTYNGNVQVPEITVKFNGKLLQENIDYVLTYSDRSSTSPGKYTVTAEGIDYYTGAAKKEYLIVPPANSIKLDNSAIDLIIGETQLIKATTDPSGAYEGVTWASSDAKVATVSGGKVKAVGKGTATITAKTNDNKTAVCTVRVNEPLANTSALSAANLTLGKALTMTGSATGGIGSYQYAYVVQAPSGKWTVLKGYSTASAHTWTPAALGKYTVQIKVKDSRGNVAVKSFPLKVLPPLTNNSKLSAASITKGTTIRLTGAASGGTSPYQYAYVAQAPSGEWKIIKNYSTSSTHSWTPAMTGKYTVQIKVKDSKGTVVVKSFMLNVLPPLTNNSKLSAASITKGTTIRLTGAASGGTSPYKYAYLARTPGGEWKTIKNYSTSTTHSWTPAMTGKNTVKIKVKDSKGTVASKSFTLNVLPPLTNNSKLSATSITKGTTIRLTGAASGGAAPYQYAYVTKTPGGEWKTIRNYSTSTTHSWTPAMTGKYTVKMKVKDSRGTVAAKLFTLNVVAPLKNNSTVSASTISTRQDITVTGAATGGTGPYQYALYYKKSGASAFTMYKDFSTTSRITFKPASAATYILRGKIKDKSGKVVYKDFTVTVTKPLTNASTLSASTLKLGGSLTMTGSASGGTSPYQYALYYKKNGASTFTMYKDFSTTSRITFKPTSAAAYILRTKVKDKTGKVIYKDFTVNVTKP